MIGNLEACLAITLREEGDGLVSGLHSKPPAAPDRGGLTRWGISQASYPGLDIANLTRDEAVAIYIRDFWRPCWCDRLPTGLDLVVFDFAVTSGVSTSVRALQRAVRSRVDGIAGPETMRAARLADRDALRRFANERSLFYRGIVRRAPEQGVFLNGWLDRCTGVAIEAAWMAAGIKAPARPALAKEA